MSKSPTTTMALLIGALCCGACVSAPALENGCSPATIWLLGFRDEIASVSVAERTIWRGELTVDDDSTGISEMIETCLRPSERININVGRRKFDIEMPSVPGSFYVTVYADGIYKVRTIPPILD